MYSGPSYGGAPAYSLGLGSHAPALSGIGDSVEDAKAYLRAQWARFVALGPSIVDMQHRAALAAYDATQRGDTEAAGLARDVIRALGELNVRHGRALDLAETYRDALGLSGYPRGLGALPAAAIVAITGLAVTVAYFFRAYAAESRKLDMIEAGTLTPAEAAALSAGVGAAPAQILGGLAGLTKWLVIGGVAWFMLQAWQSRPKPRRRPKRNPPLVVYDSNPPDDGEVFGEEVAEVWYRHVDDGGHWMHEFGPGVQMSAYPDGSVGLSHADGRRVWDEF
jgi:hypothetical protein